MVVLLPLLWSCAEPGTGSVSATEPSQANTTVDNSEYEVMDGTRLLSRLSLDLRGIRPDAADLIAIQKDPELIDEFVDAYLNDPLFEQRIVDLYSAVYLTRQDTFSVGPEDYYNLSNDSSPAFAEAVCEEPLRVLAHIAANDLPYT